MKFSSPWLASVVLAAAGGWLGAHAFATTPTAAPAPRFPQLTLAQLDDGQRAIGERIAKESLVGIAGPYNAMLRSPLYTARMFDLINYFRSETPLPPKLKELTVLVASRPWRAQVEWLVHAPRAIQAGLSPQLVADLKAQRRPTTMTPDEAVVYDFITELTTRHALSDATFGRARKLLGDRQVVDLTGMIATYVSVSMIQAMAEQDVPPGKESPFKPGQP